MHSKQLFKSRSTNFEDFVDTDEFSFLTWVAIVGYSENEFNEI